MHFEQRLTTIHLIAVFEFASQAISLEIEDGGRSRKGWRSCLFYVACANQTVLLLLHVSIIRRTVVSKTSQPSERNDHTPPMESGTVPSPVVRVVWLKSFHPQAAEMLTLPLGGHNSRACTIHDRAR